MSWAGDVIGAETGDDIENWASSSFGVLHLGDVHDGAVSA